MILVFDIGNTNIVMGVMAEGKVKHQFRLQSDRAKTTDEYAISVLSLLEHAGMDKKYIEAVMISSVVPPLTFTFTRVVKKYFCMDARVVDTHSDHGLKICIDAPDTLGADRLMSAVASHTLFKSDCIIVDFGTATTLEVLTARGEYLGGIIFPGVKLSAEVLHQRTAQLPEVSAVKPPHVVGTNTVMSIQSGLYYGYIELVDGLITRILEEKFKNIQNVKILATGGMGRTFARASRHDMQYEASLILYGLYFMYERSEKRS